MNYRIASALLASSCLISWSAAPVLGADSAGVQIDADDIGGRVASEKGPEAGVWVIAETHDLPTRFIKMVVTDEQGRYVLPDLPAAKYKVWVRGYGLVDSNAVQASPGKHLDLKAALAPTPAAAAEYYPSNYWFSLIRVPDEKEFPGTGPSGNGIAPAMAAQQDWIAHLKEQCHFCHQLGIKATRELANTGNSIEAWDQRVQRQRAADDTIHDDVPGYVKKGAVFGATMNNNMTRFGRQRGLQMFADWTDRIAKGEVPKPPRRPEGIERNVVLTSWDIGDGRFIHDSSASYKLDPTVGANGPLYAVPSGQAKSLRWIRIPASKKNSTSKISQARGIPMRVVIRRRSMPWAVTGCPSRRRTVLTPHSAQMGRLVPTLIISQGRGKTG